VDSRLTASFLVLRFAWAPNPRTNQSQLREPNHFTEVAQRYAALLHRLHPERASEQGLRSYDALSAPTSAQEIQRTVRVAPSIPSIAFAQACLAHTTHVFLPPR